MLHVGLWGQKLGILWKAKKIEALPSRVLEANSLSQSCMCGDSNSGDFSGLGEMSAPLC